MSQLNKNNMGRKVEIIKKFSQKMLNNVTKENITRGMVEYENREKNYTKDIRIGKEGRGINHKRWPTEIRRGGNGVEEIKTT